MSLTQLRSRGILDGTITAGDFASGVGGKVLQVVSTTKTDSFTNTSSTFVDLTGLSVSITPSSASNKILLLLSLTIAGDAGSVGAAYKFVRASTDICIGDTAGSRLRVSGGLGWFSDNNSYTTISGSFLDSPSTTSATTYKIQVRSQSDVFVNRGEQNGDDTNLYQARSSSTLTAIEIAG